MYKLIQRFALKNTLGDGLAFSIFPGFDLEVLIAFTMIYTISYGTYDMATYECARDESIAWTLYNLYDAIITRFQFFRTT